MGELVHGYRDRSVGRPAPRQSRPQVGTGRALNDDAWTGTVIEFDEVAPIIGRSAEAITDAVSDDGLVRRRKSDPNAYFRRRVAFRAWADRIAVAVQEQHLAPRANGTMGVTGPYGPATITTYDALGPVARRTGEVAVDARRSPSSDASAASAAAPKTDRAHQRALSQLAFLPEPVRKSVMQRAPRPDHFIAEAIRLNTDSATPTHRVSVLRLDSQEAIVVMGSLFHGATHWQVEQRTYSFIEPDAITGPARPALGR
ncbi:hypothetical protein [Luteipulveratus halotolerans]|uniref:Uncharacterized protein n=1 Tax=Luteipulveratus halotolerans TaxID=1631356 RepID=A0A0L6CM33_9MICO|nr:hypothetical protein [Luteipulveratus halotolerans]KNX38861.1 hypothetical protein VV01_19750 [Luteipulveratus halotolerans]